MDIPGSSVVIKGTDQTGLHLMTLVPFKRGHLGAAQPKPQSSRLRVHRLLFFGTQPSLKVLHPLFPGVSG